MIHCVPRAESGTEETSDFYLLAIHAVGRLKWKGQLSSSSSHCQVPQRSFLIQLQELCLWFIRIRKGTKRGMYYWALTNNHDMNKLLWDPKVGSNQLSRGGWCLSIKVSQFCCQSTHWACPLHASRKKWETDPDTGRLSSENAQRFSVLVASGISGAHRDMRGGTGGNRKSRGWNKPSKFQEEGVIWSNLVLWKEFYVKNEVWRERLEAEEPVRRSV